MSFWTSRACIVAIILAGTLLPALNGFAAVMFTVNSTDDLIDADTSDGLCKTVDNNCTLRAAIMSANKASGGDVTIMLPAGTYTLVRPAVGLDGDDNGDLNLTAPTFGNPTITITGAGADVTIIDANHIDRVLSVTGRTAIISGVTFRNGSPSGGANGGGILADGSLLTLTGCKVTGNTSPVNGGGIFTNTSLTLRQTTVAGNMADAGGGVYTTAVMDASDCQFSGNEAVNGNGGGIENLGGNLTIEHCTLSGNTASGDSTHGRGGGIDNVNDATTLPTLTVGHSTLSGNTAAYGGGILIVSGSAATTLSQSTISSNVAHGDGGGIHVGYSPLIVINSTIVLNTADNNGGGIYHQDGGGTNVNIYNSTIVGNGADQDEDFNGSGGGVFLIGGSGGSNGFNIYNTILADNIVSNHQEYDDCSAGNDGLGTGVLKTHARNLFGNGINCTINQISGSYAALTDPSLGVLRNNGGPTQTMALLAGSNAINGTIAGVCNDSLGPLLVDQRGFARADGACDVGAFEYDDIFADGFE